MRLTLVLPLLSGCIGGSAELHALTVGPGPVPGIEGEGEGEEGEPDSTAEPDDSGQGDRDTGPEDSGRTDSGDLEPGSCLAGSATIDEVSTMVLSGPKDTGDGLSGTVLLLQNATGGWDAAVHGRSATVPFSQSTDGAVALYPGLGRPEAWLFLDPVEGELEVVAAGGLGATGGDTLVVGLEHPGLIGARVTVHEPGFGSRSALEGETVLVSPAVGGSPTVAIGDSDGDGLGELFTGWADEVERWVMPLPAGELPAGDGDQAIEGYARQWMVVEDADGDGYDDLLAGTTQGAVVLLGGTTGIRASLLSPDHRYSLGDDAGADQRGIAVGDEDGDGLPEVAIAVVAQEAGDPVAWVLPGLSDAGRSVSTDETSRYQLTWADLDGDGGDELVLGRVPSAGAAGGLLIYEDLDSAPLHVSAAGTTGLLGGAFSGGQAISGGPSEQLVVVDPWGAGEGDPSLYVVDPCASP